MASIATIGVYGFERDPFLATLAEAEVDLVLDVRQRRRSFEPCAYPAMVSGTPAPIRLASQVIARVPSRMHPCDDAEPSAPLRLFVP